MEDCLKLKILFRKEREIKDIWEFLSLGDFLENRRGQRRMIDCRFVITEVICYPTEIIVVSMECKELTLELLMRDTGIRI